MFSRLSYRQFFLGYRFDRDREMVTLILIDYFLILLFSLVMLLMQFTEDYLYSVSYRYAGIAGIALLDLVLIRFRAVRVAKLLIITTIPFLLLIVPAWAGLQDNEFYFWFPYVPIALSILPHFIFHPRKDAGPLVITLVVYFFLVIFIDNLLLHFSDGSLEVIPVVENHSFYYNLVPAVIFFFVNAALGMLFLQNHKNEKQLQQQKTILEEQNRELSGKQEELVHKNRELDQALNQLKRTQTQLLQSEKMASMSTLTSGVAHEINNPLNFIAGSLTALESMMENLENEKPVTLENMELAVELITSAREGVDRATHIVRILQDFSLNSEQERTEINIHSILEAVFRLVRSNMPEGITLESNIPDSIRVRCDKQKMHLVFLNIIENAVDAISSSANPESGRISLDYQEEDISGETREVFRVFNTGPAIPDEDLQRLFDPFYSTKRDGKNRGLGLSVSYNILREHGGTITARNLPGGVAFSIYLPRGD